MYTLSSIFFQKVEYSTQKYACKGGASPPQNQMLS